MTRPGMIRLLVALWAVLAVFAAWSMWWSWTGGHLNLRVTLAQGAITCVAMVLNMVLWASAVRKTRSTVSVVRCKCGTLIQWLTTASGRWAPFLYKLVPIEEAPDDAWVVVNKTTRGRKQAVLAPLKTVGASYRAGITQALIRHDCPRRQWLKSNSARTPGSS